MAHARVVAAGIALAVVIAGQPSSPALAQEAPATAPKLTFDGDTALWTMAIRPDKTSDFEAVMKKLKEGLLASGDATRRQQASGWRVMRVDKPMPDGNIAYVHIIHPVVPGADYTIMQTLYDAFPDERQQLYEQYRGAFAQNLSLATGSVAVSLAPAAP